MSFCTCWRRRRCGDGEHGLSAAVFARKSSGLSIRCPHCHNMIELIVDASLMEISCSSCGGTFSLINNAQDTRDAATVTQRGAL